MLFCWLALYFFIILLIWFSIGSIFKVLNKIVLLHFLLFRIIISAVCRSLPPIWLLISGYDVIWCILHSTVSLWLWNWKLGICFLLSQGRVLIYLFYLLAFLLLVEVYWCPLSLIVWFISTPKYLYDVTSGISNSFGIPLTFPLLFRILKIPGFDGLIFIWFFCPFLHNLYCFYRLFLAFSYTCYIIRIRPCLYLLCFESI